MQAGALGLRAGSLANAETQQILPGKSKILERLKMIDKLEELEKLEERKLSAAVVIEPTQAKIPMKRLPLRRTDRGSENSTEA
jgi:hypothetical protein